MKRNTAMRILAGLLLPGILCVPVFGANNTAPKKIPVAYDVDVVVAGGSSGAVAAAVTAAKAGKKVFLVTPRGYLGNDLAGDFQLWLNSDEMPETELAKNVYDDPFLHPLNVLDYEYTVNRKGITPCIDSKKPSRLKAKTKAIDPLNHGLRYDTSIMLNADLGSVRKVEEIEFDFFTRDHKFRTGDTLFETSDDQKQWTPLKVVKTSENGGIETRVLVPSTPFRYLRMKAELAKGYKEQILGRLSFYPSVTERIVKGTVQPARPMHVKTVLEKALRKAGVELLLSSYPSELLTDESGNVAGIVMANRMGRQAVRAKVVVDATDNAFLARIAGAKFKEEKNHKSNAKWVTIASELSNVTGTGSVKELPFEVYQFPKQKGKDNHWYEYSINDTTDDLDWGKRAAFEDLLREKCYVPSQVYTGDTPYLLPKSALVSQMNSSVAEWNGKTALDPAIARPKGISRLYVLSANIDLPRKDAEKLIRPAAMMKFGETVGEAAAKEAATIKAPSAVTVRLPKTEADKQVASNVVHEADGVLRPILKTEFIKDSNDPLPVIGKYDVVVVGGGTSGAPAGIGAARQGAKTLVLEQLYGLGGVGTLGMIGGYWYGNRVGFTTTIPQNPLEVRMEKYRSEIRKAGGDIWYGVIGSGIVMDGNKAKGVVVSTPFGRGVVLCDVVIDATGNSDMITAAGGKTRFLTEFFALQHSLVPLRKVGHHYFNGDCLAVDSADPLNMTQAFSHVLENKHSNWLIYGWKLVDIIDPNSQRRQHVFDLSQAIGSRERRRIIGDFTLDWIDQITVRTFPDSIAFGLSDYDSHGYQVHPYFMLKTPRPPKNEYHVFSSYVPYRCLLPKGFEGILVVGLGLSANRDAMPIIRMQPELHNIGYAAGLAAAMAVQDQTTPRGIDVKKLQQLLVEAGNIDKKVLEHKDSFPVSEEKIKSSIQSLDESYDGIEWILSAPETALPLLKEAYKNEKDSSKKLVYAHVLGIMGEKDGVETLIKDAEKRLKAGGGKVHYESDKMDRLTQLIWAMGYSRDKRVIPVLCKIAEKTVAAQKEMKKTNPLYDDRDRVRALSVSFSHFKDSRAVPYLKEFYKEKKGSDDNNELITAYALYLCGDSGNTAKNALEQFARSSNGPFAFFAWNALTGQLDKAEY